MIMNQPSNYHYGKAKPINKIDGKGGIVLFRRNIRSVIRGFWNGAITRRQATSVFNSAIENAIDAAWLEGAADCNITEDELTIEELTARDEFILNQQELSDKFLDDIAANNKANKGQLTPLLQRGELWVNRYNEGKVESKTLACANQKGEWILGPTEKHCRSCAGFNGRVYRFSVWRNSGALPQSQRLACNGFRCQCRIDITDKPITKGKFPTRLLQ